MKKIIFVVLMLSMMLSMLAGCAGAKAETEQTYTSAMQTVGLNDDEMLQSLQNAAKALQDSINETDESATVEVEVDDSGKCTLYASGRDDEGNSRPRQELYTADSVADMFEVFYDNNWIDVNGNVLKVENQGDK